MKKLILFIVISVLSSFNTPAWALGKLGHNLVCQLAFEQLTPATKHNVTSMLESVSTSEKQQVNKYNYANKNSALTFAKACTWADAIKNKPQYKSYKSWHYINVDRFAQKIKPSSCKKNCLTQAINVHTKALKNAKKQKEKTEALLFLGHWLGDIHQPMHVSFSSDLGGNKTHITSVDGKCTNMHWLWDECLLTRQTKHKKLKPQLSSLLPKLRNQLSNAPISQWQQSTVYDWANESLAIVKHPKTQYCQQKNNHCTAYKQPVAIPTSEYQQHFAPIINERVIQASVRLAHLIEKNLSAN